MTPKDDTLKQSGVQGTRRLSKTFRNARLTLTAWYTIGVFLLLVVFNLLIYFIFTKTIHIEDEWGGDALIVEDRIDGDGGFDDDTPVISDTSGSSVDDDLLATQAFASAIIMVFIVIFAWVLSRKALRPIEESYERQERFIADAAHELRTPLAVMRAGADVALSREQSPTAYRTFIADMLEESKRLSKLSDDLLALARGSSNASVSQDVDLGTLVRGMCDLTRPYAEERGLTLSYAGPESSVVIYGVAHDIQRALMNVITNAVDYTPHGSVAITLGRESNDAFVCVVDTGIGIASEDLPLIFDRFYKADSSRGVRKNGAGLGLAIVKEIVERHGGFVDIKSQLERGTTVTLRFPLAG